MNVPARRRWVSQTVRQPGEFGAGSLCRNARARGADELRRSTGRRGGAVNRVPSLIEPGRVSYKTAEHVRQLAEQLGYRTGRMERAVSERGPRSGRPLSICRARRMNLWCYPRGW